MMPDPFPGHPTPGMHLRGWMSPTELDWLATQAAAMRTVIEIGSYHGRSSFALAEACPGTVHCIDPWADDDVWAAWNRDVADRCPNVVAHRALSPAAGVDIADDPDMVFIDGSHDYEDVHADITYWLPRTRGLLCGHDYLTFPGVAKAVDELLGDRFGIVPNTWIWAMFV